MANLTLCGLIEDTGDKSWDYLLKVTIDGVVRPSPIQAGPLGLRWQPPSSNC